MAIPDFQTIMLPALQAFASGGEHRVRDLIPGLADHFGLTAQERRELLPSGKQARFDNRVHWAASYMKQAGLLQPAGRGLLAITSRGQDLLAEHPGRLSVRELERFPEFREFKVRTRAHKAGASSPMRASEDVSDPEEALETAWQTLRDQLAQSVLERLRAVTPQFFERVVVDVLVSMGYGGTYSDAAQVVGGSGDGGVDGVIKQDRLGLDAVYVQAKRWDGPVGRPTVQSFAGALDARQSTKGVMITTSTFTPDARKFVNQISKRIVLIDGEALARYMVEFGVGVATAKTYEVRRVDLDYFEEG
jgi:restriction system protein